MSKRNFGKNYKTPQELVTLLESRGLIIYDKPKAQLYLESIGYYRLSAYMHPLLKDPKTLHQYKDGATFKQVMMLYRFDKKLCILLFNEIEKIEIAVREAVINITAEQIGDMYWLTNSTHLNDMRRMTRPWITIPANKQRVYYNMCIIKYFIDIISPNNDMLNKMHNLFNKFPEINLGALGFPLGWEQEPLWIRVNN